MTVSSVPSTSRYASSCPVPTWSSPCTGAWTTLNSQALQVFEAKPLPARDPKGIAGKLGLYSILRFSFSIFPDQSRQIPPLIAGSFTQPPGEAETMYRTGVYGASAGQRIVISR